MAHHPFYEHSVYYLQIPGQADKIKADEKKRGLSK